MTARGAAGLLSFLIPLCLFLFTLCPTAYWLDSGELIACASSLGIAHPTGYPLYVVLGRLFSQIPLGETAERISSLSAASAAASSFFLYLGCLSLSGGAIASLSASLTASLSLSLWDVSNTAEVYSLNIFFTALAVFLMLRVTRGGGPAAVCLLAYSLGLGMTNHLTLGALLPAAVLAVFFSGGSHGTCGRRNVPVLMLFLLAGLSLYFFLPLRAGQDPALNWGDPRSPERIIAHLTLGSQSGYFFTRTAGEVLGMFGGIRDFYLSGFGLPASLLIVAGCIMLFRREPRLCACLLVPIAVLTFFVVNFGSGAKMAEEQESFYLPATVFAGLFLALPLARFLEAVKARWPGGLLLPLARLLVLLVPLQLALANFPQVDKRGDRSAMSFAGAVYESMRKPALLLTDHTSLAFLFTYAQLVEGRWKDAVVLYIPLLSQDWYRRKAERHSEGLVISPADVERNIAFLVRENHEKFSIYALQAHPRKVIPLQYLTPHGPVMRVGLAPAVIDRETIESHRRLLAPMERDSSSLANANYRANLSVIDLTAAATFVRSGFPEDAVAETEKSLLLDPRSPAPYLMLAEIREMQGENEEAERFYRKALEREPANAGAMLRLAALLEEAGSMEEALSLYREAVSAGRGSPRAEARLGLLLLERGIDVEEALSHLERAVSLGDSTKEVQDAIRELRERGRGND